MKSLEIRPRVQKCIDEFIAEQRPILTKVSPSLNELADFTQEFLSGGKRLRAAFCYWGYIGAGGEDSQEIICAATSLEFLQACALIHDDVMDASDTRRGKPSIHKRFEKMHKENKWLGETKQFGMGGAILLGDLVLSWADELLLKSGLDAQDLLRGKKIYDLMRTELMAGQFLDIFEQTQNSFSIERALKIARYKSGKYSIERPLHFGAALAHPDSNKEKLAVYLSIYSEYGLPLGEAFQLRDDLLGVFGDPIETGKPAGDDLREGKRTALVSYAYEYGDSNIKTLLIEKLGKELSEHEISTLRDALITSGAVAHIEDLIEKLSEIALDSIERDELNPIGKKLLSEMVELVTKRSF